MSAREDRPADTATAAYALYASPAAEAAWDAYAAAVTEAGGALRAWERAFNGAADADAWEDAAWEAAEAAWDAYAAADARADAAAAEAKAADAYAWAGRATGDEPRASRA